jgi:hypothetical protein
MENVVKKKVVNGRKPVIDPRYRSRAAEGQLVEIIERCWTYGADGPTSLKLSDY